MKFFNKVSNFFGFTRFKERLYCKDTVGISEADRDYINRIKGQNSFGILSMFLGGISFAFGPIYVAFPIITIIFVSFLMEPLIEKMKIILGLFL